MVVGEPVTGDCSICHRSLLVGEALHLYHDAEERTSHVCELCRDRARRMGLHSVTLVDMPRLRVQASGSGPDPMDRDGLIEGMGREVVHLKEQLGAAQSALDEQSRQEDVVRVVTDRLRRQERELDRMRRELDPVARADEQRTVAVQAQEIRQLRQALRAREERVVRLTMAREAETNPPRMCGFALEAFNSSEHADRMARIARTLGEPDACVEDQGSALPRHVILTLSWDIAWYRFLVKLDLGTGRASVHEIAHGGDPAKLPAQERVCNARWRESGLVLS